MDNEYLPFTIGSRIQHLESKRWCIVEGFEDYWKLKVVVRWIGTGMKDICPASEFCWSSKPAIQQVKKTRGPIIVAIPREEVERMARKCAPQAGKP